MQLSINAEKDFDYHLDLGARLAGLRFDEDAKARMLDDPAGRGGAPGRRNPIRPCGTAPYCMNAALMSLGQHGWGNHVV